MDIKPVHWIGSSLRDLKAMPEMVRDTFGYALYLAQQGRKDRRAKALAGFGSAGVMEVVESDSDGTYRAVYTVRFANAVYVLHCFQKKSRSGIATPKVDMNLIRERLKLAEAHAKGNSMEEQVIEGTGNVYTDLGIPDSETMLVKAHLATAIADSIASQKLTQSQAAEILGMTQPKLSNLLNGRFRGISEAKMMECLTRLGRDVRIVIGQKQPRRKKPGRIEVLQEVSGLN